MPYAETALEAPASWSESQRATVAVAGLAWSFLARAAASDWSRSSVVLAEFQRAYNTHRLTIGQFTRVNTPAVSVDGRYGAQSQNAIGAALLASVGQAARNTVVAIPLVTTSLPAWFRQLDVIVDRTNAVRQFDSILASTDVGRLPSRAQELVSIFISGEVPVSSASSSTSRAPLKPSEVPESEVTEISAPIPKGFPTWLLVTLGLSVAVFAVWIGYGYFKKGGA